jgi:3-oxoadipate enol-lactonase
MPFAPVNRTELYYESHGEGPAVVFLHGAAGNHLSWWQQIPTFRQRYRCITIDHRGFGFTKDPDQSGATEFVDDLASLLDHLEVTQAALVAQSMGGRTALSFALNMPERVTALVMADTWGFFDWPELQEEIRRLREERGSAEESPLVERALGRAFQEREPAKAFLYRQIAALNPPRDTSTPPGSPTMSRMKEEVGRLTVPTLFIVGSEDTLTPPEAIHRVHEVVPGSEYHEFPGLGHSVYFEDPQGFNELVGEFLAKHAGRQG